MRKLTKNIATVVIVFAIMANVSVVVAAAEDFSDGVDELISPISEEMFSDGSDELIDGETSVKSVAAHENELSDGSAMLTTGEEAVVAIDDGQEQDNIAEIHRPYWKGEPMEFVWATLAPMNELQLFTLDDPDDAEGFIYGMWVAPGFVLYKHSERDVMHYPGWTVDWEAEDERIRPRTFTPEQEAMLYFEHEEAYASLAEKDGRINLLLHTIAEDLDDLWWLRTNATNGTFKRPNAMVRGLVSDIQNLEAQIQDLLQERNKFWDDVICGILYDEDADDEAEQLEPEIELIDPEELIFFDEIIFEEEEILLDDGWFTDDELSIDSPDGELTIR